MYSLKELYRIGMGPSSSHTMAPRRAAEIFLSRTTDAHSYRVTLMGSLAATGKGHFTDKAIISVLGENTTIIWKSEIVPAFHPNGMLFEALNKEQQVIDGWQVYSVGGGALRVGGEADSSTQVYPLSNLAEIVGWTEKTGKPLWAIVDEYEGGDIDDHLEQVWYTMTNAITQGLKIEGVLLGGLQLPRKAYSVNQKAKSLKKSIARTGIIASYALAVSEENASCGQVVTAPTCGSCGIVPAVLTFLKKEHKCSDQQIIHALKVAGIVGNVVKTNGSISGAEVGCQGEVGVACAMAAAAAAQLLGGSSTQIEYAAEIGLEHFLGLTCDPVMGLVQIPCIERNALAANKAVVAAEYALLSDGQHRVSFDQVVETMMKTGHDIPSMYRETSEGGLAKIVT